MKKLIRLYPAWWRRRYGPEMTQLLDDLAPASPAVRLRVAADLLLGVLDARLAGGTSAGRAIGVAAGAAVIGGLPLGALIYVSNVVLPAADDTVPVLAGWLYLTTLFLSIGAVASRVSTQRWSWPAAGAVAGVIMATLITGTFAWVDNSYFGIISRQPQKIADFRGSGMTNMRSFVNLSLEHQVVGITVLLTVFGVVLATLGARTARSRLERARA